MSSPSPPSSLSSDAAASNLAALEKLTPTVAHDLRGAINTLAFQIEILRGPSGSDPARRDKTLAVLSTELDRLHGQIERLVGVIAPKKGAGTMIDLGAEVVELKELLVAYGRKRRISIETSIENSLETGGPTVPVRVLCELAPLRRALLAWAMVAVDRAPIAGVVRLVAHLNPDPTLLASWTSDAGEGDSRDPLDLSTLQGLFDQVGGQTAAQGRTGLEVQFAPSSND